MVSFITNTNNIKVTVATPDTTSTTTKTKRVRATEAEVEAVLLSSSISSVDQHNPTKKYKATTESHGLTVIPVCANDPIAMQVMECVNQAFLVKDVRGQMKDWTTTKVVRGVRAIQGQRYEVFVCVGKEQLRNNDNNVDCFAQIMGRYVQMKQFNQQYPLLIGKSVHEIRQLLLDHAIQQARKDPRIGSDYVFDNFSLLISYESAKAQEPHIDLIGSNVQCGLYLTNNTPATITYRTDYHITTADDLFRCAWPDMPHSLLMTMRNNNDCINLLAMFGDCLNTTYHAIPNTPRRMKRGNLTTLPGSILHAGPKTRSYRCLLFFSGWKNGSTIDRYNPDTQTFRALLCADLLNALYAQISIPDRRYMVEKLQPMLLEYKNLYRHLSDEAMRDLCYALAYGRYNNSDRETYIQKFVEGKGIVPDKLAAARLINSTSDQNFTLISVDNLYTEWEGTHCMLQIFRLKSDPDRVIILYPRENEWEGNNTVERYVLHMKGNTDGELFDGTNGTLWDHENNEIKCFCKKEKH